MGINFNIVKKPKVEEDDGEELELEEENDELDDDDDDNVKTSSYDPKKKMIKFMGIIVIVMIVILIILFIVSLGRNKTQTYTYSEIESILEKAAKSYFKDHPDSLPTEEGYIVEVESANLVAEGKMNDLSEYPTKDGVTCTGSVKVQMEDDEYLYSPVLNCGDKYSTVLLTSKVVDNNEVVTSGDGLYSRGGEYVFRGENVNNYIQLGESLWRIVKITADDEIVLINQEGAGYTTPWDNRYNEALAYDAGINNYSVSRIKDYLDQIYKNPDKNQNELILSKKDKSKLVEYDLCIGKKSPSSEDNKNADECKQTIRDQKIGLLTLSDFIYASVDPNCKSASTKSCKNYNYLVVKADWWLMTANSENTYEVFEVKSNGTVIKDYASNYALARPVVHLNSSVLYKSGKGTLEKPYKVR
jgi:hypothetical protein